MSSTITPNPFPFLFQQDMAKKGWKLVENVGLDSGTVTLKLVQCLRRGEDKVSGDMMLQRVKDEGGPAGQHHAEVALNNQWAIPAEWRPYALLFVDTLWRDLYGNLRMPYLGWDSGWILLFFWLEYDFDSSFRVVRLCNPLHPSALKQSGVFIY